MIGVSSSLNKLFLSQNKILKIPLSIPINLVEISLDNNPVSQFTTIKRVDYGKSILALSDKILNLDGKSVDLWREDIAKEYQDNVLINK